MAKTTDLLQGTLAMLVLRTLATGPLHGVGIADRIAKITRGVLVVGPGSLFPALHRLAENGWIEGEWGELESGRRAKFYVLTKSGRAQLATERRDWRKLLTAIDRVLAQEG
jgi:PadR family transcriptional regulator PadR